MYRNVIIYIYMCVCVCVYTYIHVANFRLLLHSMHLEVTNFSLCFSLIHDLEDDPMRNRNISRHNVV